MIADDRGSLIADLKKFCDRLRSYMETHFCDRLRSCDRDRRRSSVISCDRAIIWKPKFCDLRSKRVPKYFEFRPMIQRFLTKPEYSFVATAYLL